MDATAGGGFLVTGASGLIGKRTVARLLEAGNRVLVAVRNMEKARNLFGDSVEYLCGDVAELPLEDKGVHYIIHCASNTSSASFVRTPVDVMTTNILGTRRVLEFARRNPVRSMAYLSTMEVYGAPMTDEKIGEQYPSNLDSMSVRSSYPESKRVCETLCAAYFAQYGVPSSVLRLTQTFGPGVEYGDGRVFAELARCAIERRDIVLHTRGESKRSYLYLDDAVDAILMVLLHGRPGEAYNAANEETYCSILEMANMVAELYAERKIRVLVQPDDDGTAFGYAPTLHMNLDTAKLRRLGWRPRIGLKEMFRLLIADMEAKKGRMCVSPAKQAE